jgi:hypothetical protein
MSSINHLGDKYGRHSFGALGVRGHHRPAHHDFGSDFDQHHVWLDNVESDVGASDNPCDIHRFQLPFSKSQRKDFK